MLAVSPGSCSMEQIHCWIAYSSVFTMASDGLVPEMRIEAIEGDAAASLILQHHMSHKPFHEQRARFKNVWGGASNQKKARTFPGRIVTPPVTPEAGRVSSRPGIWRYLVWTGHSLWFWAPWAEIICGVFIAPFDNLEAATSQFECN